MDMDWLKDGRKVPDDVMFYIRRMAVNAVRVLGESPELVAKLYNFNRTCIYRWLKQYDEGGFDALESKMPPGAKPLIDLKVEEWLKETVLKCTPVQFSYDTNLWTCVILTDLIKKKFDIEVSDSTIRLHLKAMNFSFQKPEYQDEKIDYKEVENFLNKKFPLIQQVAIKMDADIAFEDEAGVGVMTRNGRTWGLRGKTPVVKVSMQRGGYNVLSAVTAQGSMDYLIKDETIKGSQYIEFLEQLIVDRDRPLILLADNVSFHKSKEVRNYVGANRKKLRVFFLPKRAPAYNPDEQVWNEVKNNSIGKQPIMNKADLKDRLTEAMENLKFNTKRIISFFQLPRTKYASGIA
jgi:transposase